MNEVWNEFEKELSKLGRMEISAELCFVKLSELLVAFADSKNLEKNAAGLAEAGQVIRDMVFPSSIKRRIKSELLPKNESLEVSCARGIGLFLTQAAFNAEPKMYRKGATVLDEYFDEIGMWPEETLE